MNGKLIYHTDESSEGGVSPFDSAVMDIVDGEDLRLCCPYLGLDYLNRMTQKATAWKLLTDVPEWLSLYRERTRGRVVEFILANRERIHHCNSLHAKVIIADCEAMLGSANFTKRGTTKRVEMSVLIKDPEAVEELKVWFDRLWCRTRVLSEAELRAVALALPSPPSVARPTIASPFPGVTSTLRRVVSDVEDSPAVQTPTPTHVQNNIPTPPNVALILAEKSPGIQNLVRELRRHLDDDKSRIYPTDTNGVGGDLRHEYSGSIYSDMRFRQKWISLKLCVGRGRVNDPDFVYNNGVGKQSHIGTVKLYVDNPIPDKVIRWIAMAKRFTIENYL